MRSLEAVLIGFFLGGLVGYSLFVARETTRAPELVVVRDTIRTACCDQYLKHIEEAH